MTIDSVNHIVFDKCKTGVQEVPAPAEEVPGQVHLLALGGAHGGSEGGRMHYWPGIYIFTIQQVCG